jgi:RHS repeat-associated protein
MVQDFNSGISNIQYNVLNLPDQITFNEGHTTQYSYDALGVKRRVIHTTVDNKLAVKLPSAQEPKPKSVLDQGEDLGMETKGAALFSPDAQTQTTDVTDYCGHIVYENGIVKYILTPEGYMTKNGSTAIYNYYLKDHLGNNRVVISINDNNYSVIQKMDYYPFGMPYTNGLSPERQPYKFGGKELDEMHGLNLYDFGARAYSGILGRFSTTMDPLCEKYYWISPYAY